ncbi:hypothetical protein IMCC3088_2568 [Aequoribacter fuscus]|uniref:Uncharacterized protein n=1 Tax=Aequoribacter fuscus TaxID=2518989 RepID=F3L4G7_9GAMM|nr:hypothetical protein IMCC3088_2568 [Aequoribacter fuscus]
MVGPDGRYDSLISAYCRLWCTCFLVVTICRHTFAERQAKAKQQGVKG